jgi:hypothetical protein
MTGAHSCHVIIIQTIRKRSFRIQIFEIEDVLNANVLKASLYDKLVIEIKPLTGLHGMSYILRAVKRFRQT